MKRAAEIVAFSIVFILAICVCTVAGPVPDTGQTQSYTETFGEDSDYLINPPSLTKLDANGNDLSDSAASWLIVRGEVSGSCVRKNSGIQCKKCPLLVSIEY